MDTQRLFASVLLAAACAAVNAAPQGAAASARELRAAQCVAALQVSTEALARQAKAGNDAVRPVLRRRLEAGTAFVGDAYLHGTTDEARARALADNALEAQKALSAAKLAERQAACEAEGTALIAKSNALERSIVKQMAKKRMEKLLRG